MGSTLENSTARFETKAHELSVRVNDATDLITERIDAVSEISNDRVNSVSESLSVLSEASHGQTGRLSESLHSLEERLSTVVGEQDSLLGRDSQLTEMIRELGGRVQTLEDLPPPPVHQFDQLEAPPQPQEAPPQPRFDQFEASPQFEGRGEGEEVREQGRGGRGRRHEQLEESPPQPPRFDQFEAKPQSEQFGAPPPRFEEFEAPSPSEHIVQPVAEWTTPPSPSPSPTPG